MNIIKLLFICTHNRCRSVLSEAVTRQFFNATFEARSAGSQPAEAVHPLTLKHLISNHISTDDLYSKSWGDLGTFTPDIVITVCDNAAGETCPAWLGSVLKVHWGLVDPSKMTASDLEVSTAFDNTINEIKDRVKVLNDLKLAALPRTQWLPSIQQGIENHQ